MSNFLYFTPGPSQLYHSVSLHMQTALREQVPSISHRSQQFKDIMSFAKEQLRNTLNLPDGYHVLFTASANEIWERIIQNFVEDSSHHYVNGAFSKKFYKFTEQYQLNSSNEVAEDGKEFGFSPIPEEAELISATINETSVGYAFDHNRLADIRKEHPNKLIAADLVSAVPGIAFDFNLVDIGYFSVQKCFGLPAGLGVWIVNDRAVEKYRKKVASGMVTGSYHDMDQLLKKDKEHQTPETPNMLNIYLLGKVAEDMNNRGIKMIQNETRYKSTLLYQVLENHELLAPFISQKKNRSHTVIVGEMKDNTDLLKYMQKKKIIIGTGYGSYKSTHIRIANFPAHSKEQIEMLVDLIEGWANGK